jgi:hypothetical protein
MLLKNRICILFLHYSNDDVTIKHYELLKKYNPTKNIYPIGFENHNLIDGSHIVCKKELYPKNNILNKTCKREYWSEADLLIYDFIYHNNLPHDKYLIIEWDTYCNCSIEEFYGEALSKETFGHTVHNPVEEDWNWYRDLTQGQKDNLAFFGGYTPTSGLLISKEILIKINQLILDNPRKYDNIFSELRLGSLIKIAGHSLNIPFENSENFMNWNGGKIIFDKTKNGYYHPIKTVIN